MAPKEVIDICNDLLTEECFSGIVAKREKQPTREHLVWMIYEIKINSWVWSEGKIGRWLGFIQGVMCVENLTTIDKERERNVKFSREKNET